MLKGACNCGAVAFEIQAPIKDICVCHCSICRRASGVHGMAVLVVAQSAFTWVQGQDQMSHWQKPGHDWATSFCRCCGSTLPGQNDTERLFVPAGLIFEGSANLQVAHHIFVGSKAPWFEIGDGGKQHPEAFEG
ncbi:GFA family protein [Marinicella meishanensis]|uniref:GFA family protein n=1 Tax=Marinicella meishanensis TaxID=2873263 RepID=UPI001CBCA6C5|nr:GFA family protein [Marinicella sp. NBU2979]